MDLSHLFTSINQENAERERIEAEHRDDGFFNRLDPGRQKDVVDCIFAIRTSKNPLEVHKARKALKAIYDESMNGKLKDARRWYLHQKDLGNYEEAKNFLEDVEKRPKIYNPYGGKR